MSSEKNEEEKKIWRERGEKLRKWIKRQDKSQKKFAAEMEKSENYLSEIIRGKKAALPFWEEIRSKYGDILEEEDTGPQFLRKSGSVYESRKDRIAKLLSEINKMLEKDNDKSLNALIEFIDLLRKMK